MILSQLHSLCVNKSSWEDELPTRSLTKLGFHCDNQPCAAAHELISSRDCADSWRRCRRRNTLPSGRHALRRVAAGSASAAADGASGLLPPAQPVHGGLRADGGRIA